MHLKASAFESWFVGGFESWFDCCLEAGLIESWVVGSVWAGKRSRTVVTYWYVHVDDEDGGFESLMKVVLKAF